MNDGWYQTTLGAVITLQRGFDLPVQTRTAGQMPVVASTGVVGSHADAAVSGPGVVIGRSGSIGGAQYLKRDFWPLNTTLWVKDFKGNDPRFVYYLLRSIDFSGMNVGSGVPTLNRNHVHPLPVSVPKPTEQRAVAGVLGALDDKIELNRRMNETLAQLAVEHFRREYWRSPDRETWAEDRLDSHLDVVRGLSYTGSGLTADGLPLHNLNSIYEGGGYKRTGLKRYSGEYKQRHVVQAGDVIVANTEQGHEHLLIGFPAILPAHLDGPGLFSHHLYRVRPTEASPLTPALIYLLLLAGPLRTEVAGYANGTTVNMLPLDALQKPVFRVPSPELARRLDELVKPLFARAESAETESETLAELRDALLPKLISGELRVRDAETKIEAGTNGGTIS